MGGFTCTGGIKHRKKRIPDCEAGSKAHITVPKIFLDVKQNATGLHGIEILNRESQRIHTDDIRANRRKSAVRQPPDFIRVCESQEI